MRSAHILAGTLALLSGAVALHASKGAALHRKSGTVFVYAMLFLSVSGALMAASKPTRITVIAGLVTFYLVLTAQLTVRRPVLEPRRIDAGAMLMGLAVGLAGVGLGFGAAGSADGNLDGYPAAMYFSFGGTALLASLGDARAMLARRVQGTRRIARHLWRMCLALLIATGSLFLGLPRLFPEPLRESGVLTVPVLWVLVVTLYWLARVRFQQLRARARAFSATPQGVRQVFAAPQVLR